MASIGKDDSDAVTGRRRRVPLLTDVDRLQIQTELLDVIEYRKSGLSVNWIGLRRGGRFGRPSGAQCYRARVRGGDRVRVVLR